MPRIDPVDPATTEGKTRSTLDAVHQMLGGFTPNLHRTAAVAPAVLQSYVGMAGALAGGTLKADVREAIALAVAELDGCDYCLSAHTVLGKGAGLSDGEIEAARKGASSDPKTAAILRFAQTTVVERGRVGDNGLAALRAAGVTDSEALEIIGNVVLNILTNYLNIVADTEIDFPIVRTGR
jgi:uncharacterized peroxidase-related enzyme